MRTILKLLVVGLAARWVINKVRERQTEPVGALPRTTTPSVPAGTTT